MQYVISESNLVIEDRTFANAQSAWELHADGRPYHTFRTQTVLADGNRISFRRCTFENTAGPGRVAGQAIALYLDGDEICLDSCILRGHQDTLFLAPLPPKEYEKDGFLGPKQYAPRTPRTFRFRNCLIEGGVDFFFGGATAYFDDCEFRSVEPGYVFAPSTPEGVREGFVARNCRFTFDEAAFAEAARLTGGLSADPAGSCYIARPWREYAKVTLRHCFLDAHINPKGWDDWGKVQAHRTVVFREIDSFGPGADHAARPEYVRTE